MGGLFAGVAAYGAMATLRSQKRQIKEQRQFIADQSSVLELQRHELSAVKEGRRWEQARKVSCGYAASRGNEIQWLSVANRSSAPVYGVNVLWGGRHVNSTKVVVSRFTGGRTPATSPVECLNSLEEALFKPPTGGIRADIYFTDDAGQRWHMDAAGGLVSATQDEGMPRDGGGAT
ncbi:hypothetical protein [Streptomyces sp. NPDC040750]|uniref:hypothetical protein n=1 Tax=Streptomyces sp. NPDC040750 TaxID=3154491 RepID=UPI0034106230